jgi:hypothetical protein
MRSRRSWLRARAKAPGPWSGALRRRSHAANTAAHPTRVSGLQFVADGVFYAELNELLTRELAEHGYSGAPPARVAPLCAWTVWEAVNQT